MFRHNFTLGFGIIENDTLLSENTRDKLTLEKTALQGERDGRKERFLEEMDFKQGSEREVELADSHRLRDFNARRDHCDGDTAPIFFIEILS